MRSCNGCTKCCEGYVTGEAKGIPFYPGKPCHFQSCKGCSIYNDRPKLCRDFKCVWVEQNSPLPEWMYPKVSNIIVTRKEYGNGKDYIEITEAGDVLKAKILSWFTFYYFSTQIPIAYQIEGGWNYIGPKDFIDFINSK